MPTEATGIKPTHVLVVEDNPTQRETLRDILEFEGFEILACGSAAEASEIIGREDLSVAILDLRLPDQPGTKILERIREHDARIQVILYTAYGSFESAKDSVNFGAFAYLEKTTHPEELVRQVHRASRRWMSEALRAAERRYRTLTELAPVGIFDADAGGRYLWVNQRWAEITGLAAEAALGEGWTAALDGGDRERVIAAWSAAVAAGEPFAAEYCCRRADGERAWVYAQARPETDNGQGTIGYVGTITDVSERKRAEEALRLRDAALEQALLPVAVLSAEVEDPRFEWVNPAFARRTGYGEEELLGSRASILNGVKTSRDLLDRQRHARRRGRSFVGDLINYRKDGVTFAVEWRIDPIRDDAGEITHWVAILR